MNKIKTKLYRILRNLGMKQNHINLLNLFNEELKFDSFDEICYLNSIENSFNIMIPDIDLPNLKTIDRALDYLYSKTSPYGGLN